MEDFNLDDIINHRIAILATLIKRHIFRIISEKNLDITPDQWVVLHYLWQENGLSIGDIANRSKKDFANVTRIVDRLKSMGYVSKRKSKTDGRSFNVYILPKADEIRNDIQNCWQRSSEEALNGITKSEQNQLLDILDKIERNVMSNL